MTAEIIPPSEIQSELKEKSIVHFSLFEENQSIDCF